MAAVAPSGLGERNLRPSPRASRPWLLAVAPSGLITTYAHFFRESSGRQAPISFLRTVIGCQRPVHPVGRQVCQSRKEPTMHLAVEEYQNLDLWAHAFL